VSCEHTRHLEIVCLFAVYDDTEEMHVLSMMGVNKESISKFLIGNTHPQS